MHEAIANMLEKYPARSLDEYLRALREIMQEIALLGLWRSKFFEHAAFYGGTALRILYGLDRFSEDLDFSLLDPNPKFKLTPYLDGLDKELQAFGFDVQSETIAKKQTTAIVSAFLKADTNQQLLQIKVPEAIRNLVPRGQKIQIKLELDTDPPPDFATEMRYLLQPIPFAVKAYAPPDLFAGKMHAVLCRQWKTRVKGRDWYDLVWYAANHPQLHLKHLESRLRQTGHWTKKAALTSPDLKQMLETVIGQLDVNQARKEVAPFVAKPENLEIWSQDFFRDIAGRIKII
jgi:predicted nucleotidyltransferase component of viral defense system